jgi:Periplasmic binding protein-like domain
MHWPARATMEPIAEARLYVGALAPQVDTGIRCVPVDFAEFVRREVKVGEGSEILVELGDARRADEGRGHPSAIIAFNDRAAVGLIFALREAGVRIPDHISIIGYDDVHMAALPFIDLTTVGQDATATARCVVEQVAGRLESRAPAEANDSCPLPRRAQHHRPGNPARSTKAARSRRSAVKRGSGVG